MPKLVLVPQSEVLCVLAAPLTVNKRITQEVDCPCNTMPLGEAGKLLSGS